MTHDPNLRQAVTAARRAVEVIVEHEPGIELAVVYRRIPAGLPEPAVRTAIWDLISERRLIIRRGNRLHPPPPPAPYTESEEA